MDDFILQQFDVVFEPYNPQYEQPIYCVRLRFNDTYMATMVKADATAEQVANMFKEFGETMVRQLTLHKEMKENND